MLTVVCNGIKAPIGTGQWVFDHKTYDSTGAVVSALYDSNPAYWGGAPSLSSVEVLAYTNASQITADVQTGHLELAYNVLPDSAFTALSTSASAPNLTAVTGSLFNTRTVMFNTAVPGLSNPALRWALIHAIDKAAIIQQVLHSMETNADTLFTPGTPFTPGLSLYPLPQLDLTAAALLLNNAGWQKQTTGATGPGAWVSASTNSRCPS